MQLRPHYIAFDYTLTTEGAKVAAISMALRAIEGPVVFLQIMTDGTKLAPLAADVDRARSRLYRALMDQGIE